MYPFLSIYLQNALQHITQHGTARHSTAPNGRARQGTSEHGAARQSSAQLGKSPNDLVSRIFGAVGCSRLRARKHFLVGSRYGRRPNPTPNPNPNPDPTPRPKTGERRFSTLLYYIPMCGPPHSPRPMRERESYPPRSARHTT